MAEMVGVIEGFYGPPWKNQQRLELFQRMRTIFNMNTYMYAPKDDLKHRSEWRLLYTQEECNILSDLIKQAKQNQIEFIYAISPGLDLTYSSKDDLNILKTKFEQVIELGCTSFALLFDDIECKMKDVDSIEFEGSFARAQSHVTNKIHSLFNDRLKNFLFCPTDYCTEFAKQHSHDIKISENGFKLSDSKYLVTIGECLDSNISVLWTGNQVVADTITLDHINELNQVLKRENVIIWDNFHADDYDHDRIFLGPYKSRYVQIKKSLKGVLTNPNCEFEANFNAFNTLSKWFQSFSEINNEKKCDSSLQKIFNQVKREYFEGKIN
jgi:protein O-GlcNAcase/histone acetyltransferase